MYENTTYTLVKIILYFVTKLKLYFNKTCPYGDDILCIYADIPLKLC